MQVLPGKSKRAEHDLSMSAIMANAWKDTTLTNFQVMNITGMTAPRHDAHPGEYGYSSNKKTDVNDCSHWCLPGVPDTWNQLLQVYTFDL